MPGRCRPSRTARHHVHLEFYIWDPDAAGRKLRDLLVDRARAGVRIRLLLDGMGAAAGRRFFAPLLAAGGHVARFNPPRLGLWRTRLLNLRTHRKIVVCDGRVGFLGGMNVSDRQTTGRAGEPPWRDSLLRFTGEAVRTLQRTFFEDWQFATGETSLDLTCFPPARPGDYWLQIVRSGPDRAVYPVHEFLFTAIAGADRRIWITNPYVVPDEAIHTALRSAAHRGVDARLLVPRRGDSWLVQSAMRSFYDDWLASGIRLFEYQISGCRYCSCS